LCDDGEEDTEPCIPRSARFIYLQQRIARIAFFSLALRDDAAENRAINHAVSAMAAASILEGEGREELEIDRGEQVRLDIDTEEREMEIERAS
jgi:hypothetical protein